MFLNVSRRIKLVFLNDVCHIANLPKLFVMGEMNLCMHMFGFYALTLQPIDIPVHHTQVPKYPKQSCTKLFGGLLSHTGVCQIATLAKHLEKLLLTSL